MSSGGLLLTLAIRRRWPESNFEQVQAQSAPGPAPAPAPVPATDALGQSAIKCCQ